LSDWIASGMFSNPYHNLDTCFLNSFHLLFVALSILYFMNDFVLYNLFVYDTKYFGVYFGCITNHVYDRCCSRSCGSVWAENILFRRAVQGWKRFIQLNCSDNWWQHGNWQINCHQVVRAWMPGHSWGSKFS
jgi:hypothetical protein